MALKKQIVTDESQDKIIWAHKIELQKKVDLEQFDEAMEALRNMPAGKGAKPVRPKKGAESGMSAAEKQKLKEMFDKFDSMETTQKSIMKQVKGMNLNPLKDSIAAIEKLVTTKADKSSVDKIGIQSA